MEENLSPHTVRWQTDVEIVGYDEDREEIRVRCIAEQPAKFDSSTTEQTSWKEWLPADPSAIPEEYYVEGRERRLILPENDPAPPIRWPSDWPAIVLFTTKLLIVGTVLLAHEYVVSTASFTWDTLRGKRHADDRH